MTTPGIPQPPPPAQPKRSLSGSRIGLAVFIALVAIGGLVFGVVAHVKAKVVVAGSVTLAYDPLSGKVSVSADPLGLVTKWVTVKIGDELNLTPETDEVTVMLDTVTSRTAFQVPKDGRWSVHATELVGPGLTVDYDGAHQLLRVDLSRDYVKTITISRADGSTGWDTDADVTKASTHEVVVDTSLLTTGDYRYCQAPRYCNLYLHAVASLASDQRIISDKGDPVSIPNGTHLAAICEAGGEAVRNDNRVSSTIWEYVTYEGRVGYVPAIWTGSYTKQIVRACGRS